MFPELRKIKYTKEQVTEILNLAADNIIVMGGDGVDNKFYVPIIKRMVYHEGTDAMEKKFFGYFGQAVNGLPVNTSDVEFAYRGKIYPFKAVYHKSFDEVNRRRDFWP